MPISNLLLKKANWINVESASFSNGAKEILKRQNTSRQVQILKISRLTSPVTFNLTDDINTKQGYMELFLFFL